MTHLLQKLFLTILLGGCLLLPATIFAADDTITGLLNETAGAGGAGYNTASDVGETGLARIVGSVGRVFISLIGIIFVSYTIYGGFLWMTAAGSEEKISKAKNIIRDGIIGIIVILMSAAIYIMVRNLLLAGTITTPTTS